MIRNCAARGSGCSLHGYASMTKTASDVLVETIMDWGVDTAVRSVWQRPVWWRALHQHSLR
jgi:hypothetical protein